MTDLQDRIRAFWQRDAATYDRAPSHGISDPVEAAAWRRALLRALPPRGASVLDVGAGTGAMSILAAQLGYRVTALDLSEEMLEHARRKAAEEGLEVEFVVGSALEPPAGPFDAVIERNVLWTLPDPVAALGAWRTVAPGGRLVVFEGSYSGDTRLTRLRERTAEFLRAAMRIPDDHHDTYEPDVWRALPLARMPTPRPVVEAVWRAGWRAVRIFRLRDVEWARRVAAPWPLGWLEGVPLWRIAADG